jgi:hypothetical protein
VTGASGVQNRKASVSSTPTTRSALVIDCGSVFTRVALLDLVDGRHRLLAMSTVPTTSTPPYADVLQGIHAAIAELERLTARSLLREGQVLTPEQESGDGVDAVALTVSVGGPLRLLTTGSGREALAALVYRATTGFFTALEPLAQEASPSGAYDAWETQVAQQRSRPPHAVLVVGPSREGQLARPDMRETARVLAAWTAAMRAQTQEGEPKPEIPVLFTGMPADGAMLQHALADQAHVQMMEPLSPTALAPLSQAVATLYANAVVRAIPGYAGLRGLNSSFPVAATTALGEAVRLLGQHYSMNVVGVDAGASATMLVGASAQGGVLTAIQPTAGVGPGGGAVLRAAGAASVLRWLPDTVEEAELREYVLKRMLRPRLLPATSREFEFEHALAREAILLALRAPGSGIAGLQPLDVLVGTGGALAHAPQPAQAALVLLDALQPRGITSLVLDVAQVLGPLGGLASVAPALSAAVAETDAVVAQLGPVVSTVGPAPTGQPAVRITLEYSDGTRTVAEVAPGALARLPLAPGARALLSLFPAPTIDIGLGPGQQAKASEPLEGGMLGLIIDARGRPLVLPQQEEERLARVRDWRRALGIDVQTGS